MASLAGTESRRIASLTGLRFVAAFLVFCYHASAFGIFGDQWVRMRFAEAANKLAWVGVSFFFILSGFVLTWSARPEDTVRRFWRRRIAKIYPNHVVTWLAALLLMVWVGQTVAAGPTVANLLLVHSWFPRQEMLGSVNVVSWSLSIEVFFYLSFPVLLPLVRRIRPERLWLAAGALVAAILVIPVVARVLPDEPAMPFGMTGSLVEWWFVYSFPPVRALEFVLGMVLAEIVRHGRWIRVGLAPAALSVVAGYLVALNVPFLFSLVAASVIPLALLIPAAAVGDLRGSWSPLRNRPMIFLGEISYAFYLVHYLVVYYGHLAFGHTWFFGFPVPTRNWATLPGIGMVLFFLLASIVASWLLYRLVERPVMDRWSRPRRTRDPARTAPPAPASTPG